MSKRCCKFVIFFLFFSFSFFLQNYKKRQALRLRQSQSPCKGESPDCDSPRVSPARAMPTITTREYKPTEFQGALGKLTVSSIAAPRKMIDIPLGSESGGKESEGVAKDSHKKRKHALIVIEKVSINYCAQNNFIYEVVELKDCM